MNNAKNNDKNESKVKKGEELLAVLKEILADNARIIDRLGAIEEKIGLIESVDDKLKRVLPPSPGRFTRV
jgi:hypothetical protein